MPAWANEANRIIQRNLPAGLQSLLDAHPVQLLPVRSKIKTGRPDVVLDAAYTPHGPGGRPSVVYDSSGSLATTVGHIIHELAHHVHALFRNKVDGIVQDAWARGRAGAVYEFGKVDAGEFFADAFEKYFTAPLSEQQPVAHAMVCDALAAMGISDVVAQADASQPACSKRDTADPDEFSAEDERRKMQERQASAWKKTPSRSDRRRMRQAGARG
jgi:hypothetical protein